MSRDEEVTQQVPALQQTKDNLLRPTKARLVVLEGSGLGRSYPIGDGILLGRSGEGIHLDHPGVSRRHARVSRSADGGFVVEDLKSRNGTLVNGRPITMATLLFGDRLQLGTECTMLLTYEDPSEEQLAQQRRLETVGRVSAGIAHDFNNLIEVLLASLEHLRELPLDAEIPNSEAGACVEDGLEAARQAAHLTRRLLTLSRPVGTTARRVDVADLLTEAGRLARRLFGDRHRVQIDVAEPLFIEGNAEELEQVLMNLCVNARDAMPEGGTVTLGARSVDLPRKTPAIPLQGEHVVIEVSDTGEGMDGETLRHVFEPFYTTKVGGRGTGLGLSTAFAVSRRHGGHLSAHSAPGQGTTFFLHLPSAPSRPRNTATIVGRPVTGHIASATAEARRLDVLVLDDDPLVLRSLRRQLARQGWNVFAFARDEEAIEQLSRDPDGMDVLLLDLHLGDHSAIDFLQQLAAAGLRRPVVVLSGNWTPGEERALTELGVFRLIQKPCGADDLRAVLLQAAESA